MRHTIVNCAFCGNPTLKQNRHINYAKKHGRKLFCNPTCAGSAKIKRDLPKKKLEEINEYQKIWYRKNREKVLAGRLKRASRLIEVKGLDLLPIGVINEQRANG